MMSDKSKYDIEDFLFDRQHRRPNLQMRIDFTDLMTPDLPVFEEVDLIQDSVQIWLAFTEDVDDVTNSTSPMALVPGANLLSVTDFNIRQKLTPGALATLGFDVSFCSSSLIKSKDSPRYIAFQYLHCSELPLYHPQPLRHHDVHQYCHLANRTRTRGRRMGHTRGL